ncbi:TetR/AcrR family transcriptional regulator [Streptomyces sp. O3]
MMPAAREALLNAAYTALRHRPWDAVRMVDVAAVAGVSRQTLYNEFGSKDGLARALVRRETDGYLAGLDRALAAGGLPAAAQWTATQGRDNALVHAVLTGCWGPRLPAPTLAAAPSGSAVPAQRRADGALPAPGELMALVRDRAVAALAAPGADRAATDALARTCELAMRVALSCVLVPAESDAARLVGDLLRTP